MARRVRWRGANSGSNGGIALPDLLSLTDPSYQDSASNTGRRKLRQVSQKNGPEMDQLIENSVTICASPNHQVRISQTSYRSPPGWEVGIGRCTGWQPPSLGRSPRLPPQQCIFCSSHCFLPAREADFPTWAKVEILESRGNAMLRCNMIT